MTITVSHPPLRHQSEANLGGTIPLVNVVVVAIVVRARGRHGTVSSCRTATPVRFPVIAAAIRARIATTTAGKMRTNVPHSVALAYCNGDACAG
jgi:hypothetical protein